MNWAPMFVQKPLKIIFTIEVWVLFLALYFLVFSHIFSNQLLAAAVPFITGIWIQMYLDRKPRGYLSHMVRKKIYDPIESPQRKKYRF